MPLPVSMDATWLDGSVQFNGQELRRADAALFGGGTTPFSVRGGIVLHTDTSLAVTVNGSDLITIQPGAVVIPGNEGVGNGCYRAALAAADTGQLAARNATNPRIDLVIFRALDTSVVGSHGAYTGRIEVLTGTPAASPVVPTLPTLAVELARVTVPATGGGTATVDSSFRQYASAVGAPMTVSTFARLPASAAKWQEVTALDTGMKYRWTGALWLAEVAEAAVTYDVQVSAVFQGSAVVRHGWHTATLRFEMRPNIAWAATWAFLTVPVGYRPAARYWTSAGVVGNSDLTHTLRIDADGGLYSEVGVASGTNLIGSVTYPIAL